MGVLGAVVGSQPLIMNAAQTEASKRAAIGSQLVGCDFGGPYTEPLEELLDQLRGDLGISASLDNEVQDLTLVVDRTPEPAALAPEPNFKNQRRTVSYDTSRPRSANISSMSRRLSVKRAYGQIELVITSGGKR
jgi:hypothetical protein